MDQPPQKDRIVVVCPMAEGGVAAGAMPSAGDIEPLALLNQILQHKFLVIATTLVFGVLAVAYSFWVPSSYQAEITFIPSKQLSAKGRGGLSQELGGFASMIGLTTISSGDAEVSLNIEQLQSRPFLEYALKKGDIIALIQDKTQETALSDESITKKAIKLAKTIRIKQEPSGIIRMTCVAKTPETAAKVANLLLADYNIYSRMMVIEQAQHDMALLQDELQKVTLKEQRDTLYSIMAESVRTIALARSRDEYSFKVLESALPPDSRFEPNRKKIVGVSVLLGFSAGVMIALGLVIKRILKKEP